MIFRRGLRGFHGLNAIAAVLIRVTRAQRTPDL